MQRILVVAPRGKMGKLIIQAVHEREDMVLSGALAAKERDYAGMDCGMAAGLGIITGAEVYDDIDQAVSSCDTVIDFLALLSQPGRCLLAITGISGRNPGPPPPARPQVNGKTSL